MKKLNNLLTASVLLPVLSGCGNPMSAFSSSYLDGVVVKEIVNRNSGVNNDDSYLLDDDYVLKIKTNYGIYIASIRPSKGDTFEGRLCKHKMNNPVIVCPSGMTVDELANRIEKGTKVRFAEKIRGNYRFTNANIGSITVDEIELL